MDSVTTIPMEVAKLEPAPQVPVPVEDLKLDSAGLVKAAAAWGMASFSEDKLRASHTIGKAIKQAGALKIARTIFYSGALHAEDGIKECNQLMQEVTDPEVRAALIPSKRDFTKQLLDAGTALMKSVELDGSDDTEQKKPLRSFGPGQAAGPTIIAQNAVVNNTTQKQ